MTITDKEILEQLYRKMWRALIAKNMSVLDEIHDDRFELVHMTGMHQPKKVYLESIKNGTLNYFSEEVDNIFVNVENDSGTMVGQSRVNAAVFGGGKHTWRLQLAFDVEKINGEWKLIHGVASTY